ncbi:HNH endonuclease [Rubritalea sp.]|uniref:HNH endonuclease n=1 Tax=Rubritalea sp. TaxID=2109375 RepID=UPI003EF7D31A
MLQPYTYFEHDLEKWKRYVDFIVSDVWSQAPTGITFDLELFESAPDIKEFISRCGYNPRASKPQQKFHQDIKSIYESCNALSSAQVREIQEWYNSSSCVASICEDNRNHCISTKELSRELRPVVCLIVNFLKSLWNADLLGKPNLRKHYKQFLEVNKPARCHFCGLSDMVAINGYREDYDHFLPKSKYPANSIDFKNLVPTCSHCNSKFKGSTDPARNMDKSRRLAFYPYSQSNLQPGVTVTIEGFHQGSVPKDKCYILLTPEDSQEVETWNDLYRIKDRYIEKCTSADGKVWLEAARIKKDKRKISLPDQIEDIKEEIELCGALATSNFLKLAFLEACNQSDVINNLESNS